MSALMDSFGLKGLLAFYNQTYHSLTMAVGLRSIGGSFKLDERLAAHMADNVDLVLKSVAVGSNDKKLIDAWMGVQIWLRGSGRVASADHSSDVYHLNALAYLTWIKLCSDPGSQHFAEENYTVPIHPDQHPGLGAINWIWSKPSVATNPSKGATLGEVAAIVAKIRADS